jgi:hypothetical protein
MNVATQIATQLAIQAAAADERILQTLRKSARNRIIAPWSSRLVLRLIRVVSRLYYGPVLSCS